MVGSWVSQVSAKRLVRQDCQQVFSLFRIRMKITTYQENAKMLWEAQRVIHKQNMERLAELNRQAELKKKAYEIKTNWVKPNSVDTMA